jgi:uncharacterized protein (TIGR00251 family)
MDTDLFAVRDNGTIVLRVHVQPGAGRTAVQGRHGDALKVSVAAPPQGGRANDAVAKLLSEVFGLKKDAVSVVGGETSRSKQFLLAGLDEEAVREALELALEDADRRPGSARNR